MCKGKGQSEAGVGGYQREVTRRFIKWDDRRVTIIGSQTDSLVYRISNLTSISLLFVLQWLIR